VSIRFSIASFEKKPIKALMSILIYSAMYSPRNLLASASVIAGGLSIAGGVSKEGGTCALTERGHIKRKAMEKISITFSNLMVFSL
jgi:hypothetical protein